MTLALWHQSYDSNQKSRLSLVVCSKNSYKKSPFLKVLKKRNHHFRHTQIIWYLFLMMMIRKHLSLFLQTKVSVGLVRSVMKKKPWQPRSAALTWVLQKRSSSRAKSMSNRARLTDWSFTPNWCSRAWPCAHCCSTTNIVLNKSLRSLCNV